jgi:hypothetical protein
MGVFSQTVTVNGRCISFDAYNGRCISFDAYNGILMLIGFIIEFQEEKCKEKPGGYPPGKIPIIGFIYLLSITMLLLLY